jgi:hypothetical protein
MTITSATTGLPASREEESIQAILIKDPMMISSLLSAVPAITPSEKDLDPPLRGRTRHHHHYGGCATTSDTDD